jgi:hypothetical protein
MENKDIEHKSATQLKIVNDMGLVTQIKIGVRN